MKESSVNVNSPLPAGEDGVGVPREEVNDYNNYMKEKKLFMNFCYKT